MRACLVLLPIASLAFGLAKYLEDEGSPEEQSIYDDFPRRRLIRGFENIVLSHTQSENVTNWVAYFCGNVSEYRTAFREGIKSSWTRQRLGL
ncbi:hypothetical protein L596_017536 [Steinernema carpocapsae]|uniref:Uncharacterized protein n=1 Tax=Steinernema carpocapsae TaxID=34508 RepID=A0A4U5N2D4_STECR|nr:hypothetical protein L596_017536 [Steinernema carpocapsae]